MKRILNMVLATGLVLLVTLVPAYATFNTQQYFSAQDINQMEVDLGIETKKDSEVFSIERNGNVFEFYYEEEQGSLSFTPIALSTLSTISDSKTELEAVDSGFQVNTTIFTEYDSDSYELRVKMLDTWTIDYARNEDGSVANGSLGIYNENGAPVASTGLVTAVDAAGNEQEAVLTINGDRIIMKVETSENTVYPVETSYGVYAVNLHRGVTDYFHYVGFNLVYDGSLTIGPRYFDEGSVIDCTNGWNAIYNLFYPYSPYWTNSTQTQSMNDQYWCHADFAKNKPQWNLEPWRPIVSWLEMIRSGCNPE